MARGTGHLPLARQYCSKWGAAMSKHLRRALVLLEAARPASGYMPASDAEWQKLLRANEEFAYAMYREGGVPEKKARAIAHLMHSGEIGMYLLRTSYEVRGND
jgi:hypothetical protein